MQKYGYDFSVMPADIDEEAFKSLPVKELVVATSRAKCDAVKQCEAYKGNVVISADTVVYRKKLYGKPRDLQNAVEILTELCGKWHKVFTGVTVAVNVGTPNETERCFFVRTFVKLKKMSGEEIARYVETYKPLDKAGAYAIQENCMVEKYVGDYENVIGLPMKRLNKELRKMC